MALQDLMNRPMRRLRISVTDRCNLRCRYCMPEPNYTWLPREDLLTFEEISVIIDIFSELGVADLRLTGGEPLLRRNLPHLIHLLSKKPKIRDLALTTNAVLLADQVKGLVESGLTRITISLDTLRPERFKKITGYDHHEKILQAIPLAARAGFREVKLNVLVLRGINDDELGDMIEYGKKTGVEVRFIEYMDVGGATQWSRERVFPRHEILKRLSSLYGPVQSVHSDRTVPAERYRLSEGTLFGIISSVTTPFCFECDRSRLTADGLWYLCLYANRGIDLRRVIRSGASRDEIRSIITTAWTRREDRGAEDRLTQKNRGPLYQINELREDPHLEMHTRGG